MEYANILRVMAGLNEEIRVLRERVSAAGAEVEQLRAVRDELLAAQPDTELDPAPPATPATPADREDAAEYRAKITDLQVSHLPRHMSHLICLNVTLYGY